MSAKYIIVDKIKPIIFSCTIEHQTQAQGRNVTSAGFVQVYSGLDPITLEDIVKINCWGESTSLKGIKSKPDTDAKLIKAMLNGSDFCSS